MSYTPEQIERITAAKAVSIKALLNSWGYDEQPNGNRKRFRYFSPLKNESTASFDWYTDTNSFKCWATDHGGDSIKLVQLYRGFSFNEAVEYLINSKLSPYIQPPTPEASAMEIKGIQLFLKPDKTPYNIPLTNYLIQRGITNYQLVAQYIRYVQYGKPNGESTYYGIGFQNQSGGFDIRSGGVPPKKGFKGKIGKSDLTVVYGNTYCNTGTINLFEGFMDFLSSVQLHGEPKYDTIILNGVNNYENLLHLPFAVADINYFGDADQAGDKLLERLKLSSKWRVKDYRHTYLGAKDLNEYLMSLSTQTNA